MPHKALTHKDLSRQLGVSETTIKSYRRKFPGCIPVANQGKPIRFTTEALAVCKRIRDFFELGMSIPEVRTRLAAEFPWISPEACPPCRESEADFQGEKCLSRLGGTLNGIRENLDYLRDMGFNCLYLNPIFAASSYHKYDTLDYFRIDPTRGTEDDFRALVDEVRK